MLVEQIYLNGTRIHILTHCLTYYQEFSLAEKMTKVQRADETIVKFLNLVSLAIWPHW